MDSIIHYNFFDAFFQFLRFRKRDGSHSCLRPRRSPRLVDYRVRSSHRWVRPRTELSPQAQSPKIEGNFWVYQDWRPHQIIPWERERIAAKTRTIEKTSGRSRKTLRPDWVQTILCWTQKRLWNSYQKGTNNCSRIRSPQEIVRPSHLDRSRARGEAKVWD